MKGTVHPSGAQRDVARSWLQARGFHAEENIESLAELFCVRESTAKLDGWNIGRALGAWEEANKRPLDKPLPVVESYELGAANMLADVCLFLHELAESKAGASVFRLLERAKLTTHLLEKGFSL